MSRRTLENKNIRKENIRCQGGVDVEKRELRTDYEDPTGSTRGISAIVTKGPISPRLWN